MAQPHGLTAIVPCTDIDRSEAFYARLGFARTSDYGRYRILADGHGGHLHLNSETGNAPVAAHNPFGLYLYTARAEEFAAAMGCVAEDKPWGMCEFAVSDPDGTLVRVGRSTRPPI